MKVILLAAGKGTRMDSDYPKVLAPFAGKTLIEHAVNAVHTSGIDTEPVLVVGHGAEQVQDRLKDYSVKFVKQDEQLGTGHAVGVCEHAIDPNEDVMVLYGDHATIRPGTLQRLANKFTNSRSTMAMITYRVPDFSVYNGQFSGYGRILRDEDENMYAIREAKDATEDELAVREVNPGYYVFRGPWLWKNIENLSSDNAKNEYYLTELVEAVMSQEELVDTMLGEDLVEALGVNTPEQLALAEKLFQKEHAP